MTSMRKGFLALFLILMLGFTTSLLAQQLNKFGEMSGTATFPRLAPANAAFLTNLHDGPFSGSAETMARAFLRARAGQLSMKMDLSDIALSSVQESPAGTHARFVQTVNGTPVYQSELVVSIDRNNFVEFFASNYKSNLAIATTTPAISSSQALTLARDRIGATGVLFGKESAELQIVADRGEAILAYRVTIPALAPRGDWEILVNAVSGEILAVVDQAKYFQRPGKDRFKPDFPALAKYLPTIPVRPAIQALVDQVSVNAVTDNMRRLQAFKTRYVTTAEGRDSLAKSRDWIVSRLQSFGYTDIVQQNFTYSGNTLQNIVVTKTGTRYPDSLVILGAHYDDVNNAGADDNGSGVSLTLEVARLLAARNFEYTIKYIFFSAEEQGLIGSAAYVQNIAVPGGYKVKVMINADMIGYSGGGSLVKVERDEDSSPPGNNAASAAYTDTLAALTELYSTLTTQISNAYASDYMSFEDAGYVICGFFETPENPHYHQPSDSLVYVDTNYVAEIVRGALAGVAHFARLASGSGLPFDPDPLSSAHAAYTDPGYGDNSDADSPQLSAQRKLRTLQDLTYSGGVYQLQGPFAYIEDWDAPTSVPVTAAHPDSFRFNREQQGFEDVNVYFHIDQSQRYIQSLGFTNIQNLPFHLDPHGFSGDDNSAYYPSTNKITYGEGGVDDAEDADVVLHEYGHAIHNGSVPGWSGSGEQGSLGEGFGDYWAESYSRRQNFWLPSDAAYNWVFGWDGHNTFWAGRVTNYTAHYPEGLTGTIHTDGQMWGSTLMSIWNDIGYQVLDRLVLQSHFYLPSSGATMTMNAQAVIQADRNLYGGAHVQTLVYWFGLRGFIDPAAYVPSIVHTPRGDSENPLGPYPITATIYAGGSPIDTTYIKVFWGRGALTDSLDMVRTANPNEWSASIPGNGASATYHYYIKVKDVSGSSATSPAGAPASYHSFYVGDDITAPVIVHAPLRNQPKLRWPPVVRATVTDNLGVDSVWVEFTRSRGLLSGSFEMLNTTGSTYEATFTLDTSEVQFGDSIQYRVIARDIASGHNTTMHPPAGYHTFEVINTRGVVLVVDDDASTKAETMVEGKDDTGDDVVMKGAGGRLIARTLTDYGFVVDTASFSTHDPATYPGYDLVIWSGGVKGTGVFGDAAKRTALVDRAAAGGKILVEGGEVGYVFRKSTSDLDPAFRRIVLHDSTWLSDVTSSTLVLTQTAHPMFNVPNVITGPIAFTGTGVAVKDAMRMIPADPGAQKIAGWSTYSVQGPDTAGCIVYDNNPNPLSAQLVFMPFSLGNITDTTIARKLVENTAEFLMTNEPPPSGGLSGVVRLTDVGDWSNAKVVIRGVSLQFADSMTTASDGAYQFSGLYSGTYRVTVSRAGYYPALSQRDTTVATDLVTGFDFSLTPILVSTISGHAWLADTTDHSGILVTVVGQGLSTTTDSAGVYSFASVVPGPVTVMASKAGYRIVSKDTVVANGGNLSIDFLLDVQTVILSESFEGGTSLPPGWSTVVVTAGTTAPAWSIINGTGTNPSAPPYSGTNQAKFNSYNATAGSQARLTSNRLMTPLAGLRMTFYMYHDPGYTTNFDSVTVQATTGDSITGPWVRLGNYVRYAATAAWRKDSVDLTPFSGQSKVFVSFLGTSRYGNNIYLDEINISQYSIAGSIAGIVYEDMDGDSSKDSGEPLLSGWKVYLTGGKTDSIATDGSGAYSFAGLNPGTYTVTVGMQSGWSCLAPSTAGHTVALGIGQNLSGLEFANYRGASIGGLVYEDVTADSLTDDDLMHDGLMVRLSGLRSDSMASVAGGIFGFAYLPPGSYTVSAGEIPGWSRTFPANGQYAITVQSGQTIQLPTFGYFENGSVAGSAWKDVNGNGVKEAEEPSLANWTMQLQGLNHPLQSVVTNGNGDFSFTNLEYDTYTLTEVLQTGYTGTYPPSGSHAVILLSGLDSVGLNFGNFYPDTARFRTFSGPAIALAVDEKGKACKPVSRKPVRVQYAFDLVVPTGGASLTLEFSMEASGEVRHGATLLAAFSGKKPAPIALPVVAGDTLRVAGWGLKGKVIKVKYAWGSAKKALVASYVMNVPRLAMPNPLNVLSDLYAAGAFTPTAGLVVGKALTGSDALRYGWVQMATIKDAQKTLYQKGAYHNGTPRAFDYAGTKAILGKQKSLPPTKHNNALLGEMIALRMNIIASAAGITPVGFGDLLFDDGSANAYCGMSVIDIASAVDSFLTYGRRLSGMSDSVMYAVVRDLNAGFEGAMDTTAFMGGVVCTGVRPLSEVPVLHPSLSTAPTRIVLGDMPLSNGPVEFRLDQNYPNPFNPMTTIGFGLPAESFVTLKIYDILGREVATLFDRELLDEGDHEIDFDASGVASGMYLYRIVVDAATDDFEDEAQAGQSFTSVRKLLLVK